MPRQGWRSHEESRLQAMRLQAIGRQTIELIPFYGIGILITTSLKSYYSHAGADDLALILAPTSWLIELLSGIHFDREFHTGWITHTHRMIVGPSCAGVNFFIIAFAAFCFSFVHRVRGSVARGAWLGVSLGVAYGVTITTNAIRIIAAIHLYQMDIYGEWITPQRVHTVEGVTVYCVALLLAYLAVERIVEGKDAFRRKKAVPSVLTPFFWYLAFVLGVPVAHRAWRADAGRFLEHMGLIVLVCIALIIAGTGCEILYRRICRPRALRGGHETLQS